jgi:hypothetical protein
MTSIATPSGASPAGYDLAVCYRIYPRVSGRPIFGFTDKLSLIRLSLETFKEAAGDLKLKMWVLLDNCPPAYQELVASLYPEKDVEFIHLDSEGNEATFSRKIDLLAGQRCADLVYFAEDDYLYLPRSLERAVTFLRCHPEADFLSLYDHADYHRKYIHRVRTCEISDGDRRWRMVMSTCLTFAARRQALVETADVFKRYRLKNSDLGLWLALTKTRAVNPWSFIRSVGDGLFFSVSHMLAWRHGWRQILFGRRRTLWVPTPSLATHMDRGGLAPGVDWERIFGARAQELNSRGHIIQ